MCTLEDAQPPPKVPLLSRILADLAALIVLGVLILLVLIVASGGSLPHVDYVFALVVYAVLALSGYYAWVQIENPNEDPKWLLQALGSIALGAVLFVVCVLYGLHEDPSLSLFAAANSTGIMIGATEMVCPGYTCIALAGWVRRVVIGRGSKRKN